MIKFKTNFNLIFLFSTILLIFYSCSNTDEKISLTKVEGSPAYDNSSIEIKDISNEGENFMFSFDINNYDRELHGALLDSKILADVYLELLGGKEPGLKLDSDTAAEIFENNNDNPREIKKIEFYSYSVSEQEKEDHESFISAMPVKPLWDDYEV